MALLEKIKELLDLDSDFNEEDDMVQDYGTMAISAEEEKPISLKPRFMSTPDNVRKIENPYTTKDVKVVIYEPVEYSEATNIVDSLKNKKIVVVNFEKMKDCPNEHKSAVECQKELFDFINGAVYAIEGNVKKLSSTIFVMAPPNVDIDSNIHQEVQKKSNIFAI